MESPIQFNPFRTLLKERAPATLPQVLSAHSSRGIYLLLKGNGQAELNSKAPLPLNRLLTSLDKDALQTLLKTLCERHPGLSNEVVRYAPKVSVQSVLQTLHRLENIVQQSFPFGGDKQGEYAYNRVIPSIRELLIALMDYTPHFLPPNEEHMTSTLTFLDGATSIIHRLPDWHNPVHNSIKAGAYEEMNGAWMLTFKEAAKRGAGVAASNWADKLREHDVQSGGQLGPALESCFEEIGWIHSGTSNDGTNPRTSSFGNEVRPVRHWGL